MTAASPSATATHNDTHMSFACVTSRGAGGIWDVRPVVIRSASPTQRNSGSSKICTSVGTCVADPGLLDRSGRMATFVAGLAQSTGAQLLLTAAAG